MKNDKIDEVVRSTYRYFYEDGLAELAVGALFVVTGLVVAAWQGIGSSTVMTVFLALALPTVIIGGIFIVNKGLALIKERLTYPRTGYVAYHRDRPSGSRRLFQIFALLLFLVGIFFLPEQLNRLPVAIGVLFGFIIGLMGIQYGLWRFILIALASVLIAFTMNELVDDEMVASGLTFGFEGLVLLLSGGCALWSYLKRNPNPLGGIDG